MTTRQEIHTYRKAGPDTVNGAGELLGKLPNGWVLASLDYEDGQWVAVVRGPEVGCG
jgi:hypothetical protein